MSTPTAIFSKFTYHIPPSYSPERIKDLQNALDRYGGKLHDGKDLEGVNLIITNSLRFEGWESVKGKDGVTVVTDLWVDRSIVLGKAQPPQFYSANPSQVFSGVTATATGLPPADLEVLSAGIQSLGGQWRAGLTKDVTHLFAISPDSNKYATAFQHNQQMGIKVLLPHWFDDVVRLGIGTLSTEVYEWPDPPFLQGFDHKAGAFDGKERKSQLEKSEVKRTMYATAALFAPSNRPAQSGRSPSPPVDAKSLVEHNPHLGGLGHHNAWKGKRFLLSRTLQLYGTRREAVQIGIERSGGEVLRFDGDDEPEEDRVEVLGKKKMSRHEKLRRRREADLVGQVDVLITRWRHGRSYAEALKRRKTIGTLGWMFHVQCTGIISRPVDQLLHYPIPNRPIPNFAHHVITLTNYTGEAREYLKKLITAMGASFTPSMSSQNTVLIAAFIDGTKAAKAESWSIPVVNHTWLEDCFVQWRNLTFATSKYIHFPPKVNFSQALGERGIAGNGTALASASFAAPTTIGSTNWEDEIEGLVFSEDEVEDTEPADSQEEVKGSVASDEEELVAPVGTEDSMKEVAGLVTTPWKKSTPASARKPNVRQPVEENAMEVTSESEGDEPRVAVKKAQRKAQPSSTTPKRAGKEVAVSTTSRISPTKPKSRSKATPPASESSDADDNPREKRKLVRRVTVELDKLEPSPSQRVVSTPVKRAPDLVGETKGAKGDGRTRVKRKSLEGKSVRKLSRGEESEEESEEEEEDGEDEDEIIPKPKTRGAKDALPPSAKPARGRQKKVLPVESEVDTPGKLPHKRTRSQSQVKTPGKSSKKPSNDHSESESSEPRPSRAGKRAQEEAEDEDKEKPESSKHREEQPVDVLTPSKTYAGRKKKRLSRPTAESSSSSSEGEVSFLLPRATTSTRSPAKPLTRTVETPAKAKDDSAKSAPRPKAGPKSKMLQRSGASFVDSRTVAVLSPRKGLEAVSVGGGSKSLFPDRGTVTSSAKGKKAFRVPSDDEEEEEEVSSLVSPGKLSKKMLGASKKKASAPSYEAMDVDADKPPGRRLSIGESEASLSVVVPRRNAAAKATQRLHDTIMPDLLQFEVQMRKSRKSGGGVVDFVVDGDEGRNGSKKRRESTVESVQGDKDKEGEEEDDVEPKKKKRRVSGDVEPTVKPKAKAKEDVPHVGINLMTTQVNLSEDVVRGLTKLGVKMVMRPSECTHLLAASVVRTEKFLCALAKAPFILSEKWATQSVAAKKLLAEKDFLLVDNGGESKYGVKLVRSIQRAKENKGALFSGHTFYVTTKVPTDRKLLKNVVAAHGGELSTTTPTLRILNVKPSHRHIISCKEDISIWRSLASSGFNIYTQELLLTGALRQEVEWDNPEFQVKM